MESKNDLFIFQDNEQIDLEVEGYIWNGYEDIGKSRSILKILEENADVIRGQLQHFIANQVAACSVFEKQKKESLNLLLWSSGLVEQGTLKSSAWLDSLRLLALNQELSEKTTLELFIKEATKRYIIVSGDCVDIKILTIRGNKHGKGNYRLVYEQSGGQYHRTCRHRFIFFKYLLKRWKIREVHAPKWPTEKNLSFSYLILFT